VRKAYEPVGVAYGETQRLMALTIIPYAAVEQSLLVRVLFETIVYALELFV
jgi:hypothetical protein